MKALVITLALFQLLKPGICLGDLENGPGYLARYQIVSWWKKTHLVWHLENNPQSLPFNLTWLAFAKAFDAWEPLSQLRFSPMCLDFAAFEIADGQALRKCVRKTPDIRILFMTPREHAQICHHEFGVTTLAHAFYPPSGLAHFNSDKAWSVDLHSGPAAHSSSHFDLITVGKFAQKVNQSSLQFKEHSFLSPIATHEIGHLLGLGHSPELRSVMNPKYELTGNVYTDSDRKVMEYLYGRKGDRYKYRRKNGPSKTSQWVAGWTWHLF